MTLKQCLQSVRFADEVVVMDMESSDLTVEIAKHAKARVFSTNEVGYVEPARNQAIAKAKGDWILILDADEELSEGAAEKIQSIIKNSTELATVGYRLPRQNIIWGKWIKHTGWWPDYQLRLFQKGKVHWRNKIHSEPEVSGSVEDFQPSKQYSIIHHNYPTVEEFIDRMNRYSTIQAEELQLKNFSAHALSQTAVVEIFFDEWFRRFFAGQAWEDETHGAALSFMQSCSELAKVLKVWQKSEFATKKISAEQTGQVLENLERSLHYWIADYHVQNSTGLGNLWWRIRRKLKI